MRQTSGGRAEAQPTIEGMIRSAGWFPGTEADWQRLPMAERERLAFAATGCAVAYPTWAAPVDCVHPACRLKRGEIRPIQITNGILRHEADAGWLRGLRERPEGRARLARCFRAMRAAARATGTYNPWDLPNAWQGFVGLAISAAG